MTNQSIGIAYYPGPNTFDNLGQRWSLTLGDENSVASYNNLLDDGFGNTQITGTLTANILTFGTTYTNAQIKTDNDGGISFVDQGGYTMTWNAWDYNGLMLNGYNIDMGEGSLFNVAYINGNPYPPAPFIPSLDQVITDGGNSSYNGISIGTLYVQGSANDGYTQLDGGWISSDGNGNLGVGSGAYTYAFNGGNGNLGVANQLNIGGGSALFTDSSGGNDELLYVSAGSGTYIAIDGSANVITTSGGSTLDDGSGNMTVGGYIGFTEQSYLRFQAYGPNIGVWNNYVGNYGFYISANGGSSTQVGTFNNVLDDGSGNTTISGGIHAATITGNGSSITNITAANITGALPAISGASLTSLSGTAVTSGTVADARLTSNVILKSNTNTITPAGSTTVATAGTTGTLFANSKFAGTTGTTAYTMTDVVTILKTAGILKS